MIAERKIDVDPRTDTRARSTSTRRPRLNAGRVLAYVGLTLAALIFLFPFYWLLISAPGHGKLYGFVLGTMMIPSALSIGNQPIEIPSAVASPE